MEDSDIQYDLVKVPEIVYNHITSLSSKHIGNLTEKEGKYGREMIFTVNNEEKPLKANVFKLSKKKVKHLFVYGEEKEKIRQVDCLGNLVGFSQETSDELVSMRRQNDMSSKPSIAISSQKRKLNLDAFLKISDQQFTNTSKDSKIAIMQQIRKEKGYKKTRKDKDEIKKEIFELFCERKYWPKKDLSDVLDQPESFLKEVLEEMCVYIKGGPNKGCYELNDHYMTTEKK